MQGSLDIVIQSILNHSSRQDKVIADYRERQQALEAEIKRLQDKNRDLERRIGDRCC